jgi:uncharacterized protein YjiS (DUF1127 family)
MTTINMSRQTVRNPAFGPSHDVMSRVKTYLARLRAERQLNQMDDRLLADIGLKRGDIGFSVWGR